MSDIKTESGFKIAPEEFHARLEHIDPPMSAEGRRDWLGMFLALFVTVAQLFILSCLLKAAWDIVIPERPFSFEQSAVVIALLYFMRKYLK